MDEQQTGIHRPGTHSLPDESGASESPDSPTRPRHNGAQRGAAAAADDVVPGPSQDIVDEEARTPIGIPDQPLHSTPSAPIFTDGSQQKKDSVKLSRMPAHLLSANSRRGSVYGDAIVAADDQASEVEPNSQESDDLYVREHTSPKVKSVVVPQRNKLRHHATVDSGDRSEDEPAVRKHNKRNTVPSTVGISTQDETSDPEEEAHRPERGRKDKRTHHQLSLKHRARANRSSSSGDDQSRDRKRSASQHRHDKKHRTKPKNGDYKHVQSHEYHRAIKPDKSVCRDFPS